MFPLYAVFESIYKNEIPQGVKIIKSPLSLKEAIELCKLNSNWYYEAI